MKFKCRHAIPEKGIVWPWRSIEAKTPEDAAQEYHDKYPHSNPLLHHVVRPTETTRYIVKFARVEVEGHGEMISRWFHYGLWRKGGVSFHQDKNSIEDTARLLKWDRDPKELLEEGWDGEETMEEAEKRGRR